MEENGIKLLKDHVITRCRNGRRYYDPAVKQAVVQRAAMPGASIAALAREHGIHASQLRRWVARYGNEHGGQRPVSVTPQANAFVAVTLATVGSPSPPRSLTARLPNGISRSAFSCSSAAWLAPLLSIVTLSGTSLCPHRLLEEAPGC
jgi:transposase-like protein